MSFRQFLFMSHMTSHNNYVILCINIPRKQNFTTVAYEIAKKPLYHVVTLALYEVHAWYKLGII